jgi:hypothetical protein
MMVVAGLDFMKMQHAGHALMPARNTAHAEHF